MAPSTVPTATLPLMHALYPPAAFGIVEPGVYRSSAFLPKHFEFIQRLGLKTILYLSPELTLRALSEFVEHRDINFVHLGMREWVMAGWQTVCEALVKEAIELILDRSTHPVLVMCMSGVHHTGTLVGCLRRLQQWSFTAILEELRSMAGGVKTRYSDEHFVELFDTELVTVPRTVPLWFSQQTLLLEEETSEMLQTDNEDTTGSNYKAFLYDRHSGPLKTT